MPGNRLSPRWILQMRFCRSSSLTVRLPSLASEKELLRSSPSVRGNSNVDLDTHPPSVGDCTRRFTAEALRREEDAREKSLVDFSVFSASPRLRGEQGLIRGAQIGRAH